MTLGSFRSIGFVLLVLLLAGSACRKLPRHRRSQEERIGLWKKKVRLMRTVEDVEEWVEDEEDERAQALQLMRRSPVTAAAWREVVREHDLRLAILRRRLAMLFGDPLPPVPELHRSLIVKKSPSDG